MQKKKRRVEYLHPWLAKMQREEERTCIVTLLQVRGTQVCSNEGPSVHLFVKEIITKQRNYFDKIFKNLLQNHWTNFNQLVMKHPQVKGMIVSLNEWKRPFPMGDNHENTFLKMCPLLYIWCIYRIIEFLFTSKSGPQCVYHASYVIDDQYTHHIYSNCMVNVYDIYMYIILTSSCVFKLQEPIYMYTSTCIIQVPGLRL